MDDFYNECLSKIQGSTNPLLAVEELTALCLHDLPKVPIEKTLGQMVDLLSVTFVVSNQPTVELISRFRQIRKQVDATIWYMEQVLEAQAEFPNLPPPSVNDLWWSDGNQP